MTELKEIPGLPADIVTFSDGIFAGAGYIFRSKENVLVTEEVKFQTPQKRPLDPFYYNKPIENPNDPFKSPTKFVKDEEPREGYYPLSLVEQALRPPNHLYEIDDALLAGVNRGTDEVPQWETRYFPKSSLDPEVWKQALDILEITEH
jgi:hypothetical protein